MIVSHRFTGEKVATDSQIENSTDSQIMDVIYIATDSQIERQKAKVKKKKLKG
jgi:hypothetical protein